MFFGFGYKVKHSRKSKNYQSLQGVDSCLAAVSANLSNTRRMQKSRGRTCCFTWL